MQIGLIDVDGHNFPNLALMRISAYHKAMGDNVEWWETDFKYYDIVYMSKIFSSEYSAMAGVNYSYNFDAINAVTVYTDDTKQEYTSCTVYNDNPISPCRVGAIGLRRGESQQINYINVGKDEMKERCRQYAVLYLLKECMRGMSVNFNCPTMPHFDVNKPIGITDDFMSVKNETFIITEDELCRLLRTNIFLQDALLKEKIFYINNMLVVNSPDFVMKEHKSFVWLPKNELDTLDWAAADIPIVDRLMD